jgi:hypothetical protein
MGWGGCWWLFGRLFGGWVCVGGVGVVVGGV